MVTRPRGLGATGMNSQSRLESEVAYGGLEAPGWGGLLTPYSRLRWSGHGREVAVGTSRSRAARSPQDAGPTFEVESLRRDSRTGGTGLGLMARLSFLF